MAKPKDDHRALCENRKGRHDYEILDTLEVGIALLGSETKSLRGGNGNLAEAYVRFEKGEAWLVGAHIAPYEQANKNNHEPTRTRKLLLHAGELKKWSKKVNEKGLTSIPLRMYLKGSWVKLGIALGRGRKHHDKRNLMKARDAKVEMDRARRGG